MYALAAQVNSTEQVERGTDEWHHREQAKALFEQGVHVFARKFIALQGW